MRTGLILGKFYPPTLGHQHLIEVARQDVDELLVVVGSLPSEQISGQQRVKWLEAMVPEGTKVIHIPDNTPSDLTSQDQRYWTMWRDNLFANMPYKPNVLFASEEYGKPLAIVMGMKYISVDPERKHVPISASKVRSDPYKYWDFIPPVVRDFYKQFYPKIFVVSDTHFNHENIKKYENRPDDFNETIIKNWNSIVRKHDIVIHLGDVIFGRNKLNELSRIMSQLNGKKILTRGNHDEHDWLWYMKLGFDFVCDYYVYENIAFSHAPLTPLPTQALKNNSKEVILNIHGHFHRGAHRHPKEGEDPAAFVDEFYNYQYYSKHKNNYKLIQIEDELRPFSLEEVLR